MEASGERQGEIKKRKKKKKEKQTGKYVAQTYTYTDTRVQMLFSERQTECFYVFVPHNQHHGRLI